MVDFTKALKWVEQAEEGLEAGFSSKAAQKRSLDYLNRAYERVRDIVHGLVIDVAPYQHTSVVKLTQEQFEERGAHFAANDLPFDLHQVREKHIEIIAKWSEEGAELVKYMVELRKAVKEAEIAPAPVKSEVEVKAAAVLKSIEEELAYRKQQYADGMNLARLFNGLPVSVNSHMVHGHKGAVFIRHFFYLAGKLTPLNMIIAIAEGYEREQEEKKGE